MKVLVLFVKCVLALILSCCVPKIHSNNEDTYELNLNGLRVKGWCHRQLDTVTERTLFLRTHSFSVKFDHVRNSPRYKKCRGEVAIEVPENSEDIMKKTYPVNDYIIFDCTSLSCQFNIEAQFFQSRMLGATDLYDLKDLKADFLIVCELIKNDTEIFWWFRTKLWSTESIPGLLDSHIQSFEIDSEVDPNTATSRYIITPRKMIPNQGKLLFSSEPISSCSTQPSSLHLGPGYLSLLEKHTVSVHRQCQRTAPVFYAPGSPKDVPVLIQGRDSEGSVILNPNLYNYFGSKPPYGLPPYLASPGASREYPPQFHPFDAQPCSSYGGPSPLPPITNVNGGVRGQPGWMSGSIFNPPPSLHVPPAPVPVDTENVEWGSQATTSVHQPPVRPLSGQETNENMHQGQGTSPIGYSNTVYHVTGSVNLNLHLPQMQSEATSTIATDSSQEQPLSSKKDDDDGQQEKRKKLSKSRHQPKHIIKLNLNQCCSSQLHGSSDTQCECEAKPTSFQETSNASNVRSNENAKSAASKLLLSFASFGLCFLYFL